MSTRTKLYTLFILVTLTLAAVGGSAGAQNVRPFATTASSDGAVGIELAISELDNLQYGPAIAYNWKHDEYLVVWENVWGGGGSDIYAQRLSSSGELKSWFYVPDDTTFPNRNRMQPDVAYDPVNDQYLVVWIYDASAAADGTDWDLHGRLIPWEGPDASKTEFIITAWIHHQWEPRVAYGNNPQEFFVVWMNSYQAGTPATYISGQRITAATGALSGSSMTISSGTESCDNPDVDHNSAMNQYLVTWDVDLGGGDIDIRGLRIHGNGSYAGSEFMIAGWPNEEWNPAVAACSGFNKYLVVWQSLQSGGQYDLYAQYINGDGTFDGGPWVVYNTPIHEADAEVACTESGSQFMITWNQQFSSLSGDYGIWGRFAYSDKSTSDGFAIRDLYTSEPNRWYPRIAGGDTNFLVTWEHERDGTGYQDVHGRLVAPYALFLPVVIQH